MPYTPVCTTYTLSYSTDALFRFTGRIRREQPSLPNISSYDNDLSGWTMGMCCDWCWVLYSWVGEGMEQRKKSWLVIWFIVF